MSDFWPLKHPHINKQPWLVSSPQMNGFLANDVTVCTSNFPVTKFYISETNLEGNLSLLINSKFYIIKNFVE